MIACFAITACSSSTGLPQASHSSLVSASPPAAQTALAMPTDYTAACRLEPQVCFPDQFATPNPIPSQLLGPLRLPVLAPGSPCPVSSATPVNNQAMGGTALGVGPVLPLVGGFVVPSHGVPLRLPDTDGFVGFKTLWYSLPSYAGPAVIRGSRLDAPGDIAFGEQPQASILVIPAGPTVNDVAGYREAPGGTWVRGAGCYGWQVDTVESSTVIVFLAVNS